MHEKDNDSDSEIEYCEVETQYISSNKPQYKQTPMETPLYQLPPLPLPLPFFNDQPLPTYAQSQFAPPHATYQHVYPQQQPQHASFTPQAPPFVPPPYAMESQRQRTFHDLQDDRSSRFWYNETKKLRERMDDMSDIVDHLEDIDRHIERERDSTLRSRHSK
jgi:hypothetical protein